MGTAVLLVVAAAGAFGAVRANGEGWQVLGWMHRTFPLGSPLLLAGAGIALGAAGLYAADRGLRHGRTSLGLVVSALGALALAFYFMAGTLVGAWVSLAEPGLRARTYVPRDVAFALVLPPAGLGLFGLGAAWRGLRDRSGVARLLGGITLNAAVLALFVAAQLARGALHAPTPARDPGWTDTHRRAAVHYPSAAESARVVEGGAASAGTADVVSGTSGTSGTSGGSAVSSGSGSGRARTHTRHGH
jgi:hypothetical protein